ncbi:hypothetical protein CDV55_100250 [Aspergillus turcosus]|uniref:Plastocyanin-like domain-containing protein n=1 Tax=Aspergillus turcosus TaxID=1245748 RepID=A0A229WUI5_9EURO|nr:hypothetical protein CDV55_100250 [Aspergillus turcosus]RLL94561.1 hypothetical protein CFD26_104794 [Aspergillus turcosus]
MRSNLLSATLLGTAVGAMAGPIQNFTMAQCEAMMNGHLPYTVPRGFNFSGNVRRYYVAAEIEQWDYAPTGWDNWLGVPMNQSFRAQTWGYIPSEENAGTVFDKALFRGYTDSSFTVKTEQPPWQGFEGPTLRAEVNDMIEILFVNKMDHFYASMHSMGLYYTKESEGSEYYNGTAYPTEGDGVPPGGCFVYKWLVPEGDLPNTGYPSKLYSYHSYVSMYQDQDAGLSGPVIVYNQGMMDSVMSSYREFIVMYGDNQESNSFLALQNVMKYLPSQADNVANLTYEYPAITSKGNESIWYPQLINDYKKNVTSTMLPNFFPMNGYIYANNPPFEMCQYDNVMWYLWDMGFDTHVAHWHGNNVVWNGQSSSIVPLNPGQSTTVTMNPLSWGWWHLLCHFNTHLAKGMESIYRVWPVESCPLAPLKPLTTATSTMPMTALPTATEHGNSCQNETGSKGKKPVTVHF